MRQLAKPPALADRLLRWFLASHLQETILGDLHEEFNYNLKRAGIRNARRNYWLEIIGFIRPRYLKKRQQAVVIEDHRSLSIVSHNMIRNYFKIAFRNLLKNKAYSAINIGGLAVGMAVAMVIGLWIYDEFTFNQYHQNYDRVAQVMRHEWSEGQKQTGGQSSPMPLATKLRSAYGGEFKNVVLSTKTVNYVVSYKDNRFTQSGRFMDSAAPDLLALKMLHGNRAGLSDVNTIFLSEKLAFKLFGNEPAINKIVTVDTHIDAKVTGVYADLPKNSDFKDVSYIAPFELYGSFNDWVKDARNNWGDNSFPVYVEIAPNTTFENVSAKIKNIMLAHLNQEKAARKPEVFLHPMKRWHLYSEFENGVNVTSVALRYVIFYGIIGWFVLTLACINFTNLSTARSEKRAREVGIRKAMGSLRAQLASQFLSESILVSAFAFALCMLLAQLALPWFNRVADKSLTILWFSYPFWLSGITFTLFTGLLAGSYPAFYFSALQPVKILKGAFRGSQSVVSSRKVLIVFQFVISITLIIGTWIVYEQIQLARTRPVGYERKGLLSFAKTGFKEKEDVLRSELLETGVVAEVAESAYQLTDRGSNNTGFDWKGKRSGMDDDFITLKVSHDFGKAVGWQFLQGRDFSKELSTDSSGIIINEASAKLMGLKNPVGETVRSEHWQKGTFTVLGVVKDMIMESPFEKVRPAIFSLKGNKQWVLVKIDPGKSVHEALPKIEAAFRSVNPGVPFDYKFVDEEYALKFASEERVGKLASVFAVLTILISCLGLFGLASFMAEQRTKEIGVRKVLGASMTGIVILLSRDFVKLVLVAMVIASPVAWYGMERWLSNFTYKINMNWSMFVLTGLLTIGIALLTVSFQSIKAALADPVKSLRSE